MMAAAVVSSSTTTTSWLLQAATIATLVVAWICTLVAILFQIVILLPRWTWRYTEDNPWEQLRLKAVLWYQMKDGETLFGNWDSMTMIFTWLTLAGASLVILLPAKTARRSSIATPMSVRLTSMGRKIRRFLSLPMPPYRLWLWWCDGLTVSDALLGAGWLVIHFVGVYELTEYYKERYIGWDELGLAYPQPKSVYNLEWISLAFSWTLYLDFTFLMFPVAHLPLVATLLGTSWASVVKWHRWLGHFGLWALTGHALFFYWYWLANSELNFWGELLDWNTKSSINYLAGTLAWLGGVALWLTSLEWVRRRMFKLFYATHILGATIFVVFAYIHYYWTWVYFSPGIIFWGLDVVFRLFQGQHTSAVTCVRLTPSGKLAQLDIPIDLHLAKSIHAGQDVFLQFPGISRWAWHPFTIFKINTPVAVSEDGACNAPSMTLAVKKYGSWTKTLFNKLQQQGGGQLPVRVVGPVGGLHLVSPDASHVVLFVGGVGASPALAIVHNMIDDNMRVPTTVVYSVRDADEFSMLDDRLLSEACSGEASWLRLKLYCTGATGSDLAHSSSGPDSHDEMTKGVGPAVGKDIVDFNVPAPALSLPPQPSAFGWSRVRPMQPRDLNKWQLGAALVLAWLGGFLGAVQAQSGILEKWYPGWTEYDASLIGLLCLGCIAVQAVGLPAMLVVFPTHLYRYLKCRSQRYTAVSAPVSASVTVGHQCVRSAELGASLPVIPGRPNILEVLAEATKGAAGDEVPVIVAGPTGMLHSVYNAVWEANKNSRSPQLRVIRETYEM